MSRFNLKELYDKGWKTNRDFGSFLADKVAPGDVLDCSEFDSVTNSFADEFVWRFIQKHPASCLDSVEFEGASDLLIILIKRAKARRVHSNL